MRIARHLSWFLILALLVVVPAAAGWLGFGLTRAGIAERVDRALVLNMRTVEAEIARFRYLPRLMLEDPRVEAVLQAPSDPARIAAANDALLTAARQSGAAQLFLTNAEGETIAASNWNTDGSFVGRNYAFRPYFQNAQRDGEGRFFGIGVTTGPPGYFIAARQLSTPAPAPVLVVKIDLQPLQTAWRGSSGATFALADRSGIVFLSGAADWLYRPLAPLSERQIDQVVLSRAYADLDMGARDPILQAAPVGREASLADAADALTLLRTLPLPEEGWTLIARASLAPARTTAWTWAALALLAMLAVLAATRVWAERRRLTRLRLQQGALLERRVEERTAELRAAQDALVHAEKMAALGRMSAAIVHEISQPLAAMEASLTAALISNEITEEKARSRIEKARGHIKRMLRTIKHLKSFSRKEAGARAPVSLESVMEASVDLVSARARAEGVSVAVTGEGPPPVVLADQGRLEQVLVNLLVNALDAVAQMPEKSITVSYMQSDGCALLRVHDSGAGVPPELRDRITEPFFTTKQNGESLGLGLSISRALLEEFGGTLCFVEAGSGTAVVVSLPLMAHERQAAE